MTMEKIADWLLEISGLCIGMAFALATLLWFDAPPSWSMVVGGWTAGVVCFFLAVAVKVVARLRAGR